ncbi:MAG TPA: HAD-IA family hydrolase [Planctomycetota bacterium]|jgi:putative hydrolase of the HAD superfamily|nr:HAD-IA family hydrolase [Planctomycetota bacterium]
MVIRAVFFDAGHTLLTAHPDLGTVYAETTARFGVRLPPSDFAEAFRPVFRAFVREYVREGDASDAQDYAMWREITRRIHARLEPLREVPFEAWFEALYRRFGAPEVWRLYDDAVPTLRELRARGLRLGIVSNWDTRLRRIAEGHGLDRLVDFLVISAEAGARKPDPRIFREALARAGVAAAEALHVGDLADEDVEGALAAGLRAVLLDREGTAAADGIPTIRSLAELPRLV